MLSLKVSARLMWPAIVLICMCTLAPLSRAQKADTAAAATTTQAPAHADSSPATTPPRRPGRYPRPTLDDRVQQLAKSLNLNEKQQAGLKAVLQQQQAQARQIQFDPSLSGEERIGRFRALQENTVLRIRALLNDEQKKKYDPLNHRTENAAPSQSYVDQWMRTHERPPQSSSPPQK
jgi:periplasmic protein CpxP/Spy